MISSGEAHFLPPSLLLCNGGVLLDGVLLDGVLLDGVLLDGVLLDGALLDNTLTLSASSSTPFLVFLREFNWLCRSGGSKTSFRSLAASFVLAAKI